MPRKVNLKFLLCVLTAVAACGIGLRYLHAYQIKRTMSGLLLWHAEKAEERGHHAEVARYLGAYLSHVPDDTDVLARRGLALSQLATTREDRLHAFLVLEQVLRRDPKRSAVRRRVADLAMGMERFADARAHLELLLRETPDDAQIEQLVGRCYLANREYLKAEEWFANAVAHGPAEIENYFWHAEVLRGRLDQGKRADQVMDNLVANNPKSFRAYLGRGFYRKDIGLLPEAREDIQRAQELGPDQPEVLLATAELVLNEKDLDKARRNLARGIELYPQNAQLYQALAALEMRAGRRGDAIACLRKGLKTLPEKEEKDLLWALADFAIQKGEDAGKEIERLRKARTPTVRLDYLQARVLINKGDWLEGARMLERIHSELGAWPHLAKQANLLLAQCYEQLGEVDRRYAAYQRALALDPLWEPACLGMGSTLVAMGKLDEGLDFYRRLIPKHPRASLMVARLLVLRNLRLPPAQRQWQEADRILERAAQDNPDLVNLITLRAEALAAREQFDPAQDLLAVAQTKQPKDVEIRIALAALAEQQGKFEAALSTLDRAERDLGDRAELRLARVRLWTKRGGPAAREALKTLHNGLDKFVPQDQWALARGLADAHVRVGDMQEAERLWDWCTRQRPNELSVKLSLFDLALQEGNVPLMKRVVEEIRGVEGSEGTLWRYGELCHLIWSAKQGNTEAVTKAGPLLNTLAARRPTWGRVPVCEAELSELKGDAPAAIRAYQRAIDLGERNPLIIRRVVQLLYDHRRYVEANQVIHKLSEQDPFSADLQRLTAEISVRTRDYGRALEAAQRAVSTQSKDYRDYIWLGQILWFADRRAEAEPVLRRAVELADNIPDTWVSLVQYLVNTGQQEKAEATIQQAQGKLTGPEAPVALAQCYEAIGQTERAMALYRAALSAKPEDVPLLRSVANFYLRIKQPGEAEPHLQKIIGLTNRAPEDAAWARRILAIVLAASGDYQKSRQALTILGVLDEAGMSAAASSESVEDLRARALVLAAQKGRRPRRQAIALLENMIARQPPTPDDQFLLAQLYESVGDWTKARQRMLTLIAASGERPEYLAHYAFALLHRGELSEAQVWLDKLEQLPEMVGSATVIELKVRLLATRRLGEEAVALLKSYVENKESPSSSRPTRLQFAATVLDGLAQTFPAERKYVDAAEAMYREFVLQQPTKALLLVGFLGRQGRLAEALDQCERAWHTCSAEEVGNAVVAVLQGAQVSSEQFRRVEGALAAAIAKNPAMIPLRVCLAYVRDLQGRYEEAIAMYREVLQRDNRNAIALNNIATLLALKENKGAEALELIRRALEIAGPLPELLDTRGVVYLSMGLAELAIRDLEEAVMENPLAPSHFHLAQACYVTKKQTEAKEHLRKAMELKLNPGQLHALERPVYDRLVAGLTQK